MIKVHCGALSTFSRRVHIALLEKEIEHELVLIDTAAGDHKKPEYLAMNPYGRVPTIEDDRFVLYESTAILSYLEAMKPEPALYPAEPKQNALVHLHIKLCDIEFARYAGAILFPKRFQPEDKWDKAAFGAARKPMERHLDQVAKELGSRDYLVGDEFTAADLVYIPHLHFLSLYEIDVRPAVEGWANRLAARPSAQETVPDR